jgi:hypothetical protein
MRLLITIITSVLLLSFSNTAMAQDDDRNVKYSERTEIDFDALDISGEMVTKTKFNPLIELRMDFNPEMSQSVNNIK